MADFRCSPSHDLPVKDGVTWDGGAAAGRMLDAAGIGGDNPDHAQARRGFLIYDASAPDLRGSYHLPFADLVDGRLTAIGNGLRNAASRLPQMDGVGPDLEARAKAVIDGYLAKLNDGKAMPATRAYSVTTIKTVNNDQRTIEGIASTPSTDRMGDIVESMGAQFKLPLPLLWQHNHDQPVGWVDFAAPTKDGIPFRARLAQIADPGALKDSVDTAWQAVKAGLVRGVSIGFSPIEYNYMKDGGIHFEKWDWLELSLVTIPANQDATIQTIKSIDAELRAAVGKKQSSKTKLPGASGLSKTVSLKAPNKMARKPLAEQIAALEAARAAKAARMEEVQYKAVDDDRTKDDAEREEFDTLDAEIQSIDKELADLHRLERAMATTARAVSGHNSKDASESREPARAQRVTHMQRQLPPGIAYARYVRCCIAAKGIPVSALQIAEKQYPDMDDLHMVFRAAVAAGNTYADTSGGALIQYTVMANEFVEYLRPMTVIGRIPGIRNIPFNVRIPRQTAGASAYWVGEGQPKPVTSETFDYVTLRWTKLANIAVLTDEVIRFANPAIDALVRNDLAAAIAQQQDTDFLDPANSGTTDVKPASITNGVTPVASSGATADDARADAVAAINKFVTANIPTGGLVWVMNETTATVLGAMLTTLGVPYFPGISAAGGTWMGYPVVTSQVMAASGSPATSNIVLMRPQDVMLADDGQVAIDVSSEASIQMLDNPTNASTSGSPSAPTPTTMVSLWQTNSTAVRAERFINWTKARSTAVQYVSGVAYAL